MKITVVTSSYPRFPGDTTAPFVRSISEALASLGHQVEVVAPYDKEVGGPVGSKVPVHRFRYVPFDSLHIMGHARSLVADQRLHPLAYILLIPFLIAEFLYAYRISRRQQADVIYTHWVIPNGVVGAVVASILGIPLVISLHGSDIYLAKKCFCFGVIAKWVFGQAQITTACSPQLRDDALSLGVDPEKVRLLYWGVDPLRFHPQVEPLARSGLDLREDSALIIALGRLVPKKGFDVLIKALPELLSYVPDAQLVIGGDGPLKSHLMELAVESGVADRLVLPGRIPWDNVPAFLAMGDVFALPSVVDESGNVDGLPTVLLEALATGMPIIASDIAGIPLVVDDEVNGYLCPPGDITAWTQKLSMLLIDPVERHNLSKAARQSVLQTFNWCNVAKSLVSYFTIESIS